MSSAVIYARYSSHNQREASIEDQVRVCTEAALERGDTIVEVYADRARSGTKAETRPEFMRMISDAKTAPWKTVYIYKQDRFARSRLDAAIYKHELKVCGVALVSVTEPISDGPEGILLETVLEGLAEYYSANLSQNIRRGLDGNAMKGKHNGHRVFGYKLGEDGYYHIDEEEAAVVRKMYELAGGGLDTGDIAKAMASSRTRCGKRWNAKRVWKLLQNEKYKGVYKHGTIRVEGAVPRLVSDELWSAVNERMRCKKLGTRANYLLAGKLFDAEGRSFVGSSGRGKSGKVYHYYRVVETGESYPVERVDSTVYGLVAEFLRSSEEMRDAIIEGVLRVQDQAFEDEDRTAESLRAHLADVERRLGNIARFIAERGPSDTICAELDDLEAEKSATEAELWEVEHSAPKLTRPMLEEAMDAIMAMEAPEPIMRAFVSSVCIKGRQVYVTFNVRGETPASLATSRGSHELPLVELRLSPTNTILVSPSSFTLLGALAA